MSNSFSFFDKLSLSDRNGDAEFIPLITNEEERDLEEPLPSEIDILPVKNTILFPGVVLPITANRDKSINLLRKVNNGSKMVGVMAQKNNADDPSLSDLHPVGTFAKIIRMLKMPDGSTTVVLQGTQRFEAIREVEKEPHLRAEVKERNDVHPKEKGKQFDAVVDNIRDTALNIVKENPNLPSEAAIALRNIESAWFLINFISSNLNTTLEEKQEILQEDHLMQRAEKTLVFLEKEWQQLKLKNDIQNKVRNDIDQQQREYFLQQQMRTIQEELGGASAEQEIDELRQKAKQKVWPDEVRRTFEREVKKLNKTNQQSAEFGVQRTYLETLLELPWNTFSEDKIDLNQAEELLDRDHFGLHETKQRILEYLAVYQLRGDMKSPILCLHGPPGVGKTSLGKSIAEAMGRKYVRISLGGVHDEAEIRGHRRTYIGAMPGRIIKAMKKAETGNPVIVLDEIDKIGQSAHGDPQAALLEVLDPEQNHAFSDNYIELGYDLSKVMFIATANQLNTLQPALLDRMEVIDISGYATEEKIQIGEKYLYPKQLEEHGLTDTIALPEKVLQTVIEDYTRESGVRQLDRQLAKICRKLALQKVKNNDIPESITTKAMKTMLGAQKFSLDEYEHGLPAGVAIGLAWTSVGGDILFLESSMNKGKGKLSLTGNLGKVMSESATIALEYLKTNYQTLNIPYELFETSDFHIHVPEGATPKDGPSAGIALLSAFASLLTQKPLKSNTALSGEVTLRGKVLPVGGIREKVLAAKRANIKHIILSQENERNVKEIPSEYLKGLEFHYVKEMSEALDLALEKKQKTDKKTEK